MRLKEKNILKSKKGITLIALVVTIVVLLILAGVSISMLGGENGIITQAIEAKEETRGGEVEEERNLWMSEITMAKATGITVQSMEEKLEELKNKGLLSEEEVNEILADEENSIQIGSKNISFKVEEEIEIVEPENIADWEWRVETDGTATLTVYKGEATNLVIPNYINGIPVKKISGYTKSAPSGNGSLWSPNICELLGEYRMKQTTIKEIILSKGIEIIDNLAFYWSTGLEKITIPDSIKVIGDDAFSNCDSLTEITIPSSVQTVGSYIVSNIETITVNVPFKEGEKPSGWADDWNYTYSGTVNVNYQK